MNNINKLLIKVCLALVLVTTFSCKKDFLDNTEKTRLTDATQWQSEGNADIFLNDIYNDLSNKWNSPDNLDNFTDDNDAGFYWQSYSWKQGIVDPTVNGGTPMGNTNNQVNYANWTSGFLKIRECNLFIQKLKENAKNFSATYLKKRIDEARFLRAYFYSELFMHLGGLPITLEVLDRSTMDSSQIYKARNTFEETFNFIISQLDSVVNNNALAIKYKNGDNDAGRATLGAASALKGWLSLYVASPAFNAPTPAAGNDPNKVAGFGNFDAARWAKAAAANKKFIDTYGGGTYNLFPDLNALWWEKNEYNSEIIWDRQVVPVIMGSNYEQYGGPVWINGVYYTWGNYDPTQELVDQFMMANGKPISDPASGYDPQNPYVGREKRFYDFIVYDGAPYKQDWMDKTDTIYMRIDKVHPSKNQLDFGTDDVGNTGYYFKKKINPLQPRGGASSGENYVYYRYAEVLLNYAEAQNEAVGPDATVYAAINQIRKRYNLPDLTTGLSQAAMRTAIYNERRVELCFEAKRFYDIIRWKTAQDVMNKDLHGMMITNSSPADNGGRWVYQIIGLNHPHVFTQKMYLNPIPQTVIDQNKKIVQNPGY